MKINATPPLRFGSKYHPSHPNIGRELRRVQARVANLPYISESTILLNSTYSGQKRNTIPIINFTFAFFVSLIISSASFTVSANVFSQNICFLAWADFITNSLCKYVGRKILIASISLQFISSFESVKNFDLVKFTIFSARSLLIS